ncbi:CHAD domain-containing protein [Youngiibacter multivorans]|uniref:CHAD domain-containing protein n=1 Tax=Youngiibacter multivorans TaxID=937251 RepID=A0ABS4G246_9CLOT|nr:CHAD domain-containing protein [Youngiibacter multivorans]MBP1918572.1 CHAD domain-containing protein [Youngiibacter multivorans]
MKAYRVAAQASSGMAALRCEDAYVSLIKRTLERLNTDITRHFADSEDPEPVHDARVDIRVLTSILYLFYPLFNGSDFESADEMLKDAISAFGEKREADMLIKSLKDYAEKNPDHKDSANDTIMKIEAGSMSGKEDRELILKRVKKLGNMVVSLKLTDEAKDHGNFESFAKLRLSSMIEELREEAGKSFGKKRSIHKYRIAVKKALYSLELAEEERDFGGAVWRARLKAVQDIAGSIHDAEVNMKLVGDYGIEDKIFNEGFEDFLEEKISEGRERFMFLMDEIREMETDIG